jgi:hypothetical protein
MFDRSASGYELTEAGETYADNRGRFGFSRLRPFFCLVQGASSWVYLNPETFSEKRLPVWEIKRFLSP